VYRHRQPFIIAKNPEIALIKLVPKKGVQHIDCDGSKNRPGDLKPGSIVFAQHFTTSANTGALYEPVRLENVGYTDASEC
jgi:hypothetical protein